MIGKLVILVFGAHVVSAAAMESFESMPAGPLLGQDSLYGRISADAGHARVIAGKGRTGRQALHIAGGDERSVTLEFASPTREKRNLDFWAERWTARGGFKLRVDVKDASGWSELKRADGVRVGGYHERVQAAVPVGSSGLRFSCSSDAGVLIDDLSIQRDGPMALLGVTESHPVLPVLRRRGVNPALGFTITTEGNEKPLRMEALEISLSGTTNPQDIERIDLLPGTGDPSGKTGEPIASSDRISESMVFTTAHALASGENSFWVSVVLKDQADMDGRIGISLKRLKVGGKVVGSTGPGPAVTQRIGIALRQRGDDGSNSYRIPGLVRTKAGSLLAVYDIRYGHCGDLPAQIDVGVSRSPDGGQSWEDMRIAMDAGTMGDTFEKDGVGDPAILVDEKTGRVWIAALWSHGNRGWGGSGPGMSPDETGQLMLTFSDDDGKSWSALRNITPQIKDPSWRLAFNGPGAGICMKDGTLVFPAQFRSADGGATQGKPFSTIISSKDRGETWTIGSGARIDTTEAQVVELDDASLMLNCRDNRGGSRTVMVTSDLGQTWQAHPTDRGALPEPICMASLLRWDHPERGSLLVFSNPATTSGRHDMTLKVSNDQGMSWPEKWHALYDSRSCSGYSCVAPAGTDHIGVLYEGPCELYFLRIPLAEVMK